MKKIILISTALTAITLLACSKSKAGEDEINSPKTEVPTHLKGTWMYGNFSTIEYWSQDPSGYIGNALEFAIAFKFNSDGTFEQYFTSSSVIAGQTTYQQSVTKGTVVIDEVNKTIITYPAKAHYKRSRGGVTLEERDLAKSEMTGKTTYQYSTGTEVNGTYALYLVLQGTNSSLKFLSKN
jgi:hypothetical protein